MERSKKQHQSYKMGTNKQEKLLEALRKLNSSEFKEFKQRLNTWEDNLIPQRRLHTAGRAGVARLITIFYGDTYRHERALLLINTIRMEQDNSAKGMPGGQFCHADLSAMKLSPYQQLECDNTSDYWSGSSHTSEDDYKNEIIRAQSDSSDMDKEYNRFQSFIRVTTSFPDIILPLKMPQAGFYYVGPGDRVRCFSCGGELENWEDSDDPLTRHQDSFPECHYVLEQEAEMPPIPDISQTMTAIPCPDRNFIAIHRPRPLSIQDEPPLLHMKKKAKRIIQTVLSSSVCPSVQELIKDLEHSRSEPITEGESVPLLAPEKEPSIKTKVKSNERTEEPYATECKLCDTTPLGVCSAYKVSPEVLGDLYRLDLPHRGLFCCSETGIQFRVKCAACIEFILGSWGDYMQPQQPYTYEIIGPVFNITVKAGLISAVYLPHYVCLRGGKVNTMRFRVGHYKDSNMVLEMPTRVKPFYAVLKNPTFSPIGVLLLNPVNMIYKRNIPTHAIVRLYSKIIKGCTIHLYLIPKDPALKKILDNKETQNNFFWVDKPPHTSTIHTKNIYVVGGPDYAKIYPKTLKLCLDDKSDMHPYSEIYLRSLEDEFFLELKDEKKKTLVWQVPVRKEELESRSRSRSQVDYDGQHFVDRHREELITRTSNINPIMDYLLSNFILTQEQYDTVWSKEISQEKMRKLYDYVRAWGQTEKDRLYQALQFHDRALIRDLEYN